eukprot:5625349-Pleurochrysis_carterae.AAC.1
MREAININASLLGLSNVMKALSQGAQHVPYRDSKLTMMLSDSIGGNCRTTLVVCASPATIDSSETSGTLDFGSRAMKVKTNAVVNTSTVVLDAAALAADLSDALRLRAEGGIGGQLLALEAELKERGGMMEALERQAIEAAKAKEAEVAAARAAAEEEEAAHHVAMMRMEERLEKEVAARKAAEAKAAAESEERFNLEDTMAMRALEVSQQLEDAKTRADSATAELNAIRAKVSGAAADGARFCAERDAVVRALAEAEAASSAALEAERRERVRREATLREEMSKERATVAHASASADVRVRESAERAMAAKRNEEERARAAEARVAAAEAELSAARASQAAEASTLRAELAEL